MSELWEKAEMKLKELEETLPRQITQDKDTFDLTATEKLGILKAGKIKGMPCIEGKKLCMMSYLLPLKVNGKIIGEIIGIIAENENVSNLEYKCNVRKGISNVIAYGNDLHLSFSFFDECIAITCNHKYKKALEIVDRIVEKYKLI